MKGLDCGGERRNKGIREKKVQKIVASDMMMMKKKKRSKAIEMVNGVIRIFRTQTL